MKELLVVARYNENLDWLKTVKQDYIVYNKGPDDLPDWMTNVVQLPNIGREEYAYLYYIYSNYDCLADRVIFCQAETTMHSPDFLKLLNVSNCFAKIQPLSYGYNARVPGYKFTYLSRCVRLNNYRIHVDMFDSSLRRFHKGTNAFIDAGSEWLYLVLREFFQSSDVRQECISILKLEERKFNNMNITPMCYSSIFSVDKDKLQTYNISYYQYLLDLQYELESWKWTETAKDIVKNIGIPELYKQRIIFGWIMEFMWLELFRYEPPKELYTIDNIMRKNFFI